MEDSKQTTIAAAAATPAEIGEAAGQSAYLAAAIAGAGGAGAVVTTKTVKPGWRTSELWVTLVLPIGCHLLTVVSQVGGPWGILAGALASGLYSLSRGMAKR
jgi:hypothetical protein